MIYMAVTADELELPLYVGSANELATWAGISKDALYSNISKGRSGKQKGFKLIKVKAA